MNGDKPVNALQAVLDKATPPAQPLEPSPIAGNTETKSPSRKKAEPLAARSTPRPVREGRRFIGGHFSPSVAKQLRLIAAEDDTTLQALLEEALDLLFVKKGRAKINQLSHEN